MTTAQALRVRVVPLTAAMADEVADLYARVFAGPPWYNVKCCASCDEQYGKGDDLECFHDGDPCRRCGEPLELLDSWRGGRALEVFEDAAARSGFIGMAARAPDGRLIAFSWGFAVPARDTPAVKFNTVASILNQIGLDVGRTSYVAEGAVDPDYQQLGIGSQLSYARLRRVRAAGFETVCFRTANPIVLRIYGRFFGSENVRSIFSDPDPVKADRTWYVCPLASLRSRPPRGSR
jgi:ribosomal protein S18 acetylase RimI-like enzyme